MDSRTQKSKIRKHDQGIKAHKRGKMRKGKGKYLKFKM